MNASASSRRVGATADFLDRLVAMGRVAFPMSELTAETGLSEIAATSQIHRLGPRVVRVAPRKSFFLVVGPEHIPMGSPPLDWWLHDFFTWLGQPYYLALQSAAAVLGSNPQAIQVMQVMTDRARRELAIGRLRVRFFKKRRCPRTPTQRMESAHAPLNVSTPAATVFDLVRYAGQIGGIGRALETARPLLDRISPGDWSGVLDAEDETATAQRLGFITEKTGHTQLATLVERWLPKRRALIPLVPGAPRSEPPTVSARWRVIDNSGEFEP